MNDSSIIETRLEKQLEAYGCDKVDRLMIEDVLYIVNWAAANSGLWETDPAMRVISPGKIHRTGRFNNGRRTRVDMALTLLARIDGIVDVVQEQSSGGRPRQLVILHNHFVPSPDWTAEDIERAIVARLLPVLGKVSGPDDVALAEERLAGVVDTQAEQQETEQPAAEQSQVTESTPKPRLVLKAIHDFPLSTGGQIVSVKKGQKFDSPIMVDYLLLNGFPVVPDGEDFTDHICPHCHTRIARDNYAPTGRPGRKFYRPIREFQLAVIGRAAFKITPAMIVDDPVVVRELLAMHTPENPVIVEVQEGTDFVRCKCGVIFFADDKLRNV